MEINDNMAFTLIEILMVIIIISILTAFFPFHISKIDDISLKATINKIVCDLRWARIQAILKGETYYFRIYSEDDIYKIDSDNKSDYIIYVLDKNNEINIKKKGVFSSNYTLYKNLSSVKVKKDYYDRINFTGFGTARNGTIALKSKSQRMIKIVINQLGRVRIEKW